MDIITATADDLRVTIDPKKANLKDSLPEEIKIKARTTIQLDGDLIVLLPTKNDQQGAMQIDSDVLNIHKENVDFALKNLTSNIQLITDGIIKALALAKENNLLPIR